MTFRFLALGLAAAVVLSAQATLPGTAPLTASGDLAAQMVDGIHAYLARETAAAREKRAQFWKPDYSSPERYSRSVDGNRERFRKIIGAVDTRLPVSALELDATTSTPALVATGAGYKVYAVRWPVFAGVTGEGLLLEPDRAPVARIVAIGDADEYPEMLAGLTYTANATQQFARRLAESGCQVLVPVLIDRKENWSGIPGVQMTNQPHREWIYRMAFEAGRHIIGYEVQKVLAAVDWFTNQNANGAAAPIGVAGYGEGGLLALASGALDERIQTTLVSGYFQPRENVSQEPIYRDVWGLVREFGDAELAGMIAPRTLIVEAAETPQIDGPPRPTSGRTNATPNGKIATPPLSAVREEVARAGLVFHKLNVDQNLRLVPSANGHGVSGSEEALAALLQALKRGSTLQPAGKAPVDARGAYSPEPRQKRQFDQLVEFTQKVIARSPEVRERFWSKADSSSPERWIETTKFYRDYVWDEVIGRLPAPSLPVNPRSRLIFDEPTYRGYEVMLDVWPDVFAYGILLVPKNIRPGERRPVVVCQHGLEGRPSEVADPKIDSPYYHRYAVRLAEEGFVTFAPQNPYIGEDRFRRIQREGHPLKLALFSFILGQHQRLLEWLAAQPFVDAKRVGFYGLSYGGKTAMRVPALLPGYALSICSADFNEWVWKTTSVESKYSYMLTNEYDMLEFDLAHVANYAELASLIAPRPFMVERGHADGVAPDEWVAYEFAKVRRFYVTRMGMPDRAEIEFFNGPHSIHGQGTFAFLRRHLHWPIETQ